MTDSASPLLRLEDLSVAFDGRPAAVDGVSLRIDPGEVVGLVGRSGSGKTLTALSILGLLPRGAKITGGSIRYRGSELVGADDGTLRGIRGAEIGLVFQDPLSALHPALPVEHQVVEGLAWTQGRSPKRARTEARSLLDRVHAPDPETWGPRLPHEWSGGMRQRALLAMAMARDPALLIVDEPTTALDVTLQAQILSDLEELRSRRDLSILLITHDLGVVAELAHRVVVMDRGRIVETAEIEEIFDSPRAGATRFLLEGRLPASGASGDVADAGGPTRNAGGGTTPAAPLLDVRELTVRIGDVPVVESVDLRLPRGGTLALVGESGCGKSTIARALVGLEDGASGHVLLGGHDVLAAPPQRLRSIRRSIQLVWQDPFASLNPRRRIGWAVERPLRIHRLAGGVEARRRALELLDRVRLPRSYARRYPHELSGGERQRVAIARALSVEPDLLILDEPFSALDAALRRGLLKLLGELREDLGFACLLVSHDLSLVRAAAERVAVVYLGRIVEEGRIGAVFSSPRHPYTAALLSAVPVDHPRDRGKRRRIILEGDVPSPASRPSGCEFRTRCHKARPECSTRLPPLDAPGPTSDPHSFRCFFPVQGR